MALVGSYILGSSGLRVYDSKTKDFQGYWVNDEKLLDNKTLTTELIKEKTETVFSKIPRLENLIIVDPGIYSNECINAAIEIAKNYAAKFKIISALMARFCYVTSKSENLPRNLKEHLIIVTICQDLCDWHILQLTSNGYDYIIDHLYEKKNFNDTVAAMAKRYSNYKTVILYSDVDKSYVNALKTKCEKMYVPNWNQMLTDGGIQKGIWMKDSLSAKSKDVIDFASGMSLKLGDKPLLSLVKQGAKLPVKKKHINFEDIRSFIITRDYQHVDYDKITRASTVIFQTEVFYEIYKYNIGVQIEKNGQCAIEFNSQKQVFKTPDAVDDSTTAAPETFVETAVKAEVEKPRKPKGKAVLGYSLFSKTCKFYNPATDKEETFKSNSSNELTFTNTTNLNDESPTKRVEDLLSQLPTTLIDAVVFVHDGRFPLDWLKQARDVARKHTSRIYFISEPMALKFSALKSMKTPVKDNQTLALTFIYGSSCTIYFLKRDSLTYSLIDEAEYSTMNLEKVRNVLLTRRSTDVAVVISDKITVAIRETFVYKEKSTLKVEFIEIENYGKAYVDGAIAKAHKVADGSGDYLDILQYCGQLKAKIDDQLGANLCPQFDQIPKTVKKVVNIKGAKEFKIIQYKSAFNKREFVLYSNCEIPSSWEDIEVTIKLYLAGLFEVTVSPQIPQIKEQPVPSIQNQITENKFQQNSVPKIVSNNVPNYNIPNSIPIYDSSLIPSRTFEGREKLQEQLYNLGCTFVVFLKEEECSASIEVMLNGKFYQVKNPSGNISTPAYFSFVNEKIKIGETALKDYRKKPEFVVFDVIHLLGRSSHQLDPKPTWRFSVAQNPQQQNFVVYEVETWEGRRAVTPEFVLGLYLKALKRLAESVSKQPQPRVTIFIPPYYKTIHNTALKEACKFASLLLVQTMQYPRD